jgi:hypothetical protein
MAPRDGGARQGRHKRLGDGLHVRGPLQRPAAHRLGQHDLAVHGRDDGVELVQGPRALQRGGEVPRAGAAGEGAGGEPRRERASVDRHGRSSFAHNLVAEPARGQITAASEALQAVRL